MRYAVRGKDIVLTDYDSFVISQTLECGQCFRFEMIDDENYVVIAFDRVLNIYQNGEEIVFADTTEDDFNNIWRNYFDLDRDYMGIKLKISEMTRC